MPKRTGRPRKHNTDVGKVTVGLRNDEIAFLDRLRADIRGNTGVAIQRGAIIRALIDALEASELDVCSTSPMRDS